MPRREASMEGRPQHLVKFARLLRGARRDAGLTIAELADATQFTKAPLSRAQGGVKLPTWQVTRAFLTACGVSDLTPWRQEWERARELDAGTSPLAGASAAVVVPPTAVSHRRPGHALIQAPPLAALLRAAEAQEHLLDALRQLADRAGCTSLREIETRTKLPRSTVADWLAGRRKPNRLDELVTKLGATKVEQREFGLALERVWNRHTPALLFGTERFVSADLPKTWRSEPTFPGTLCFQVDAVLDERSIEHGRVVLADDRSAAVLGLGLWWEYSRETTVDLPSATLGSVFTVSIWIHPTTKHPIAPFDLDYVVESGGKSWTITRRVTIPPFPPSQPGASTVPDWLLVDDTTNPCALTPQGQWIGRATIEQVIRNRTPQLSVAGHVGRPTEEAGESQNHSSAAWKSSDAELFWHDGHLNTSPARRGRHSRPSAFSQGLRRPVQADTDETTYRPKHRRPGVAE